MPRALWTGSISFGLVNVPVRLYSAISEHKLHFRFVHEPDGSPIGYQKICKAEGEPVPDGEIVKAFEYEQDEYVYMSDEDFDAARVEGHRTIEITDFVPHAQIDPIYFAHSYLVGPQDGAEQVYSLLVRAMEAAELAAVAKFVMRDRQHLGCLRIRDGAITLEQLHFADEIRPVADVKPKRIAVEKKELQLAAKLIEGFAGEWEPKRYKDTYREALCAVIEAKRKGKKVHAAAPVEEEEEPTDLMAALRASIEAMGRGKRGRPASPRRGSGNGDLEALTRAELEQRARDANIAGRSKMSKDELVEALAAAA